ncbi:hypothetical protein [Nocardia sp. alder85J]|uniref:hypothetical protein n=1 Tax=Nocardia sp. alder85J TaxID=2862949 RepID=UPI001CD4D2FA|nr:hypothetical protein [Nocardia sp. alder85J]MCX4092093.1 hypothetical protein [Nocardia sp. alder85J]
MMVKRRTIKDVKGRSVPIVAAGIVLAACSGQSIKPAGPAAGAHDPSVPYTNVWSADPGIDLFSREAELVRATEEAGNYSAFVGTGGTYPGYAKAVAALADEVERTSDLKTRSFVSEHPVISLDKLQAGTRYLHITGFVVNATKIDAVVCSYTIWPAQLPGENDRTVGGGIRIDLQNNTWDKGRPGIANRDPAYSDPRAQMPPKWDIFGSWEIAAITGTAGAGDYPAECIPWYQQQFPGFTKDPEYNYLVAPSGYTAPHHPVAQQFPEWIGPSTSG